MTRLVTWGDPGAALALLTRLPAPGADHARGARAAWAWPLVGALLGGAGALGGLACLAGGLPPAAAAGAALSVQVLATGALHEDGLADLADGLGGGPDRERRLEIMRDSRIGAFGAVALILGLGLRWSLTAALLLAAPAALLAAAALSRAAMAAAMATLPPARPDGLSAMAGRPGAAAILAAGLALALAGLAAGPAPAFLAALGAAGAAAGVGALARSRLGGQTGDVLGAAQQAAEIAALAGLAAALAGGP